MAMSADGKIGKSADHFADWTSAEDKKIFVQVSKAAKAVIFGRSTYETIGKPLKERLNLVLTSSPEKYESIPGSLEFISAQNPKEAVDYLSTKGYTEAVLGGGANTNRQFLKAGLVDEIYLTIEPIIFGKGIPLIDDAELDLKLSLIENRQLNENTVLLHYKVIK